MDRFESQLMLRALAEDSCAVLVLERGEYGTPMALATAIGYARGVQDYSNPPLTAIVVAGSIIVWPVGRYGERAPRLTPPPP